MKSITHKIASADWEQVFYHLNNKGYALIPALLSQAFCHQLIKNFTNTTGYRKTVVMEHHRFGLGSYKYWDYPLPTLVQTLREQLYSKLAPLANLWMQALKINQHFPDTLEGLLAACQIKNQLKSTPLILQYTSGGFNTLHQDLYGEVYFPLQAACFLNQVDTDYSGGEFVMTQQTPRAQAKAIVLKPEQGDMLIFTTHFRPFKGLGGIIERP